MLSLCSLARGSPVPESAVSMVGYRLYGRSSGELYQHTTPPGTAALSLPDPVAGQCPPTFHQRLPKTHRTGILMKRKRYQGLTGLSLSLSLYVSLSIQLHPSTNTYREKGQVSTQSEGVLSIS